MLRTESRRVRRSLVSSSTSPRFSSPPPAARFAASAALAGLALAGLAPAAEADAEKENSRELSRVRGLFDVDLPKTVGKFRARAIVHPHFGDVLRRDYLRVSLGARLGVGERTEISPEVESYLTHRRKGQGSGYGLGLLRLGAKHQLQRSDDALISTSVGLNTAFPVGRPPLELTDGFNHVAPYVTFSMPWPGTPRLTPFVSLGTDLIWKSTVRGEFTKNQPRSDSLGASAGFYYNQGVFKYTLVTSYRTTALIGRGSRHFTSIHPSVLWQLPPTLKFLTAGNWIIGLGLKAGFGPDGTDLGAGVKLRGEFKLARFLRRSRDAWRPRDPDAAGTSARQP